LYDFGTRFYDPELGLWLTPDAVNVYFNPYVFGGGQSGGDPINYTDPDGNCPICVILVAAVIGAAIAGGGDIAVQAAQRGDDWYKFNRTDWGEAGRAAFVGGVAGAAGGAGVLAIGGLAASATGAVGLATNSGLAAFWMTPLPGEHYFLMRQLIDMAQMMANMPLHWELLLGSERCLKLKLQVNTIDIEL
jgi:hypothetical protein